MTLALREVRRSLLRFSLLSGAIGLLVFLILFQQTLLGTLLGYFTGALENQSGEVVVFNDEARRNLEGSIITEEQLAAVVEVDGVAAAGPLGQGSFTARADGELVDAVLFGYELGGPGEPTRLVEGRLPEADGEAVASSIDASSGFDVGDVVEVGDGAVRIEVVGLAAESRFSVQPTMFVSYATWVQASQAVNPDAPFVLPSAVLVVADGDARAVAADITAAVDGVEALDRATAVDSLPGVSSVSQSFNLILGLSFLVVVLVIGFFFVILTVQKLSSLALLKALGWSTGALVRSLLVQVVLVTGVGVLVGALLLQLASLASSESFPITAEPGLIATTGGLVVVLALVASVGALRRVRQVEATDVLVRQSMGGLG